MLSRECLLPIFVYQENVRSLSLLSRECLLPIFVIKRMFAPYLCREIQCFSHRSSGGKWRRKLQSSPSKVFSSSTFNFCIYLYFPRFSHHPLSIFVKFMFSKVFSSSTFYFFPPRFYHRSIFIFKLNSPLPNVSLQQHHVASCSMKLHSPRFSHHGFFCCRNKLMRWQMCHCNTSL